MTLEQTEASILQLPPEQQRRLALWYEAHCAELLSEDAPLPDFADYR